MAQRLLRFGMLCQQILTKRHNFSLWGPRCHVCHKASIKKLYVILQRRWETGWTRASSVKRFPVHLQTQTHHPDVVGLLKVTNHLLQGYFRQRQPDMTRPGRKIAPVSMYAGVLMIFNESAFISFHPGYRPFPRWKEEVAAILFP